MCNQLWFIIEGPDQITRPSFENAKTDGLLRKKTDLVRSNFPDLTRSWFCRDLTRSRTNLHSRTHSFVLYFKKNELVSTKFFFGLHLLLRLALACQLAIGQFDGIVLMSLDILGDLETIGIWKFCWLKSP